MCRHRVNVVYSRVPNNGGGGVGIIIGGGGWNWFDIKIIGGWNNRSGCLEK